MKALKTNSLNIHVFMPERYHWHHNTGSLQWRYMSVIMSQIIGKSRIPQWKQQLTKQKQKTCQTAIKHNEDYRNGLTLNLPYTVNSDINVFDDCHCPVIYHWQTITRVHDVIKVNRNIAWSLLYNWYYRKQFILGWYWRVWPWLMAWPLGLSDRAESARGAGRSAWILESKMELSARDYTIVRDAGLRTPVIRG